MYYLSQDFGYRRGRNNICEIGDWPAYQIQTGVGRHYSPTLIMMGGRSFLCKRLSAGLHQYGFYHVHEWHYSNKERLTVC